MAYNETIEYMYRCPKCGQQYKFSQPIGVAKCPDDATQLELTYTRTLVR